MFPSAPIVHTRRAALDNLLSIYCLHFGEGVTYGHDLGDAAHYYIQYRRLMRHWQVDIAGIHDLDYDALVCDPTATIAPMLGSLGVEWDEKVLRTEADSGTVRTASAWQVRAPLHDRSSGRWRHYERQLAEPRRMLAEAGMLD